VEEVIWWWIVGVYVTLPALCVFLVWETHRVLTRRHRKLILRREVAVSVREADVTQRELDVLADEIRHGTIAERQFELVRQAHDIDALIKATVNSIGKDTDPDLAWAALDGDE